jgi:hypothetical protein
MSLVWFCFFIFVAKFWEFTLKRRISKIIPIDFGHHREKIRKIKIKIKKKTMSLVWFFFFIFVAKFWEFTLKKRISKIIPKCFGCCHSEKIRQIIKIIIKKKKKQTMSLVWFFFPFCSKLISWE